MQTSTAALLAEALSPEQLADRLARLQELTGALSRAADVNAVTDAVLSAGVPALGADEAWICLLDDVRAEFHVVAYVGAVDQSVDRWGQFPRVEGLPAGDALATDEPVVWQSIAERDRRYPTLRGTPMAHDAYIIAPMVADDTPVGALVLGFAAPREVSAADRTFARAAADQTAQALARARLHESEQRAHRWQRFLADASLMLAASLDYEDVLAEVAEAAVPMLADGCVVHLRQPDGLRPVAVAHAEPARREQLQRLLDRQPVLRNPYVLEVAESGTSLLLPSVPADVVDRFAQDDEHRRLIQHLGITSGLAVALVARGQNLGTLTLFSTSPTRTVGEPELAVAEDLAARAALAIDNARLYAERSKVAGVLQRALLPPQLPAIPGVSLAARHEPATEMLVGGDFYDLVENPDGTWTLLVGDVCGKDAAAASLTALARHTARAVTARDASPARVLEAIGAAFYQHDAIDQFCTAACARLHPTEGGLDLELALGGHPPPVWLGRDGEARLLEPGGQPLGLFENVVVSTEHVRLAFGERLVLYTDGVTEARFGDEMLGDDGLLAGLRGHADLTPNEIADRLVDAIAVHQGPRRRDDVAIVVFGPATPPATAGVSRDERRVHREA